MSTIERNARLDREDVGYMVRHFPHAVLTVEVLWFAVVWVLIALAEAQG